MTHNAIAFIPPDIADDDVAANQCLEFAASLGFVVTIPVRYESAVDQLLAEGWARVVIVARWSHRRPGWPCEVVSSATTRQVHLATVKRLPPNRRGGLHRAPSDSPIGRVKPLRRTWSPMRRDDGGFAERFLAARLLRSRHMDDT